jgi:low affinity Fe/Cu permease
MTARPEVSLFRIETEGLERRRRARALPVGVGGSEPIMSPLRKTAAVPEFFRAFARRISDFVGSSWAFAGAVLTIVVWAAAGPVYHFSDTWQLVINTGTTVVTFLMVFVMQNTQNRDAKAIHLKLDELLRGVKGARTGLVRLEDLTEAELVELEKEFEALRRPLRPAIDTEDPGRDAQDARQPTPAT